VPGHRCGHPAELASLGVTTDAEHTVLYRVIEEQVDHANDGGSTAANRRSAHSARSGGGMTHRA
jgi:hypothetical protein